MPLTAAANEVTAPTKGDWKPVPEDLYQVVIKDVDEKIMKKFQSEEEDAFYKFSLVILDGANEESQHQSVSVFCTERWFAGNKKASPSKLVSLVKAVYGFYYPDLSVIELEAEDMTLPVINDLIGKQLRVTVKLNQDGTGNRITEFMAIKKELDVPDTITIARVPAKMLAKPGETKSVSKKSDSKESETEENHEPLPFD